MVAVVAGNGLGLLNTSVNILGNAGVLGRGVLGQSRASAYVNAATGNLILQSLDEEVSGRGSDLQQLLTYNSKGTLNGGAGQGWSFGGQKTLMLTGTVNSAGSFVDRTDSDGHVTRFTWDDASKAYLDNTDTQLADGTVSLAHEGAGADDTLTWDGAQWLFVDGATQQREIYLGTGSGTDVARLHSQTDTSGHVVSYGYDANGRLSEVIDNTQLDGTGTGSGQKLVLTYGTGPGGNPRVTVQSFLLSEDGSERATNSLGGPITQVTYDYDGTGRLTTVTTDLTPDKTTDNTDPAKLYVTSYTYDGTSSRISSVTQGDGTAVSFTYDGTGRVATVTDAQGTQTFEYQSGSTKITYQKGTPAEQAWTYHYDSSDRLTQIDAPPPTPGGASLVTHFGYYPAGTDNGAGRLHTLTDAAGRTVTYGYDANGNRNYERDSYGDTIQRTFDPKTDRLLTETHYTGIDPDGDGAGTPDPATALTTYYIYDSQARLRFVITPEGRVTESRYGTGLTDSGLLTQTIVYAGGRLDTTQLDGGNPPGESQLSAWVAGLDQSQVEQTTYQYDFRGNLSQMVQYANTDSHGVGQPDAAATVTSYIYDGYGQLLHRIAMRGDGHATPQPMTSYTYDGVGRELTSVSASGTQTTAYNGTARTIQISTASGLVETRAFDSTGRLVSLTQVDTSPNHPSPARVTQYVYDALGRLTMSQDGQGTARSFSFYDGDGRLQYTVDATGAVCGYTYNGAGQLSSETCYANTISENVRAGWFGSDGNPPVITVTKTTLVIGPGGDLSADPQNDRTTTYEYDTAGRLMHQTVVTATGSTLTTTKYDGDSRVISVQTGDRLTQYYYDRDGMRVGVLDPLGYLTESKYDAAGRLVQTIRYTTRSSAAVDVSAPVWPGATNGVLQTSAHGNQPFVYHVPAAYDADGDTVSYSMVGSLPSWLTFDPIGLTLSGTPPKGLTTYNITLRASDGRQPTPKTTNVTVAIAVVNAPPTWVKLPDVSTPSLSPYSLTLPLASDVDTPQSQLTYSLVAGEVLPQGLSFGMGANGPTLTGTPTIPGSYLISVQVKDNGTPPLSTVQSFVLQVTNQGPSWSLPASIPDANHNVAYNLPLPAAVDPEGLPLTYRVVSGPSWLHVGADHTLTGTPPITATPGPQAVVLEAQDQSGATVRIAFLINVINLPPTWAPLAAPPRIHPGDQIHYDLNVPAVDPEQQKLTYSATGLPFGWQIDADTGTITGTVPQFLFGNITVTLTATDPNGASVSQAITFQPADRAPVYLGGLPDQVTLTLSGPSSQFNLGHVLPLFSDPDGDPLVIVADPGNFEDLNYFTADDGSLLLLVVNELMPPGSVFQTRVGAEDPTGLTTFHTITVTVVAPAVASPHHQNVATGGGAPSAPLSLAPMPTVISPADDPLVDVLTTVRPSDPTALRSYNFYDGEDRLIGAVNEQGFLSTTVFDEENNKRQSVRYITPVSVTPGATLQELETAGGATETTTYQYTALGQLSSVTGPDKSVTTYQYDGAGRLIRQVMDAGADDARASDTRFDGFGDVTGTVGGVGDRWLAANPTKTLDDAINLYGAREEYDSLGRLIKSTRSIDGKDHSTLYFYDADNRLTHTVDALGDVSETSYDSFGDVAAVRRYYTTISLGGLTGGSNATVTQLLGSARDPRDQRTLYHYNQRGLLDSEIVVTGTVKGADGKDHDVGFQTTDSYDLFGQLTSQTRTISLDGNGAPAKTTTTQYDYDLDGQLIGQTADIGGLNFNQRTVYDGYGRVIDSIDAAGKITQTQYLDEGRTVQVTDPLGITHITRTLDANHIQVIDPVSGQATTTASNHVARTVTVTTPLGVSTVTTMNAFGQVSSVQDGRHNTTSYEYDADGHLTGITDPLHDEQHKLVSNTYDTLGRLQTSTDARGTVTQYKYDELNRVHLVQVDPSGLNLTSQYTYNALGQQDTVTQALGTAAQRVTQYSYDLTGAVHQVVLDPQGLKLATTYQYDGLGNRTQVAQGTVSNPAQQVTEYVFDTLGRKVKEIDAPSDVLGAGSSSERDITTEYRYDSAGRLSRTIDANGQSTWFVYDDGGRLTYTIDALGDVSQNVYDADSRIVQTHRYRNPITTAFFGDVVSSSGLTLSPSSADQRSYFVYDNDGHERFVLQAFVSGAWIVTEKRYDANGNVIETRAYDQVIRDSNIANLDGLTPLQSLTTDQVQAGLRSLNYKDQTLGSDTTDEKSLAAIERTRYVYDADNRLRFTVDALGYVDENAYDAAGNVLTHMRYASAPTLSAYDETTVNGALNANRADPANHISQFAYDAAGRLRFISREIEPANAGAPAEYIVTEQVYDALGRKVQTVAYANSVTAAVNYNDVQDLSQHGVRPCNQDRITEVVYDAAGREIYSLQLLSIDGNRTVLKYVLTQNGYDALGHLVQSTTYATPFTQTDTSGSRNTPALLTQSVLDGAVQGLAQDPENRTTRFAYDALGRLRFTVAADDTLSEIVYDSLGQTIEQRRFDLQVSPSVPITEAALVQLRSSRHVGDGVTRGESYTYDAVGHLLSTTDAAGNSDRSFYDALGNKTDYIDKNGMALLTQHGNDKSYLPLVTWQYIYDLLGRVLDQYSPETDFQLSTETAPPTTPRIVRTHYTRDAFGNLTALGEGLDTVDQRITGYAYDKLNRQIGVGLTGWYDAASGQVVSRAALPQFPNAFARTLETTYDAFGDAVRTRLAIAKVGGVNQYQYDYRTYDNLGRQIHEIDPLGNVTQYAYTSFGEQTALTRYSDSHNIGTSPPGGVDALWTKDAVSTALQALGSDPKARTVTTTFDNLGHKSRVEQTQSDYYFASPNAGLSPPAATTVTAAAVTRFDYDVFGDMVHEATLVDTLGTGSYNGAGTWRDTWHYFDVLGQESLTVDALGYQTARSYDAFGNLKEVTEYANAGGLGVTGNSTPPATPTLSAQDRITAYGYDALNRQLTITRKNMRYLVDVGTVGNPNYVQVDTGRDGGVVVQTLGYDAMGRVTSQTDALGDVTRTEYDILGWVTKVIAPARQAVSSAAGILRQGEVPDPFLHEMTVSTVTTYTLNAFGQVVVTVVDPQGAGTVLTTRNTYDNAGNLTAIEDARHNITNRKFDYAGRLIEQSQQIAVSLGGQLVHESGSQTLRTKYIYDQLGRLTDTLQFYSDALGHALQTGDHRTYTAFGELKQEYKEWGTADQAPADLTRAIVASFTYDNAGHLQTQISGNGETDYFYDLAGNLTRQEQLGLASLATTPGNSPIPPPVSFAARVTESVYDLLGRTVMQRLPAFEAMTPFSRQTFDRWGNVLSRSEGGFATFNPIFDSQPEVTEGTTTRYEYNADNQVIAQHDPTVAAVREDTTAYGANVTHVTQYDVLGRAVLQQDVVDDARTAQVEANLLRTRTKQYDGLGELITEVDATGHPTRYAYDGNGNRVATLNAIGTVFVDTFDANGNILTHGVLRQADGINPYFSGSGQSSFVTILNQYQYDQANRRFADITPGTFADWNYTQYDERGLVVGYSDGINNGLTTYAYDALGNRTEMVDAVGNMLLTFLLDPNGHRQTWSYSTANDYTLGRMLSWTNSIRSTAYYYTDRGQAHAEVYSGAGPTFSRLDREYEYYENGLLKEVIDSSIQRDDPQSITTLYAYDSKGQIGEEEVEWINDPGPNQDIFLDRRTLISRDALGRMIQVSTDPSTDGDKLDLVSYSYDELGDRREIDAFYTAMDGTFNESDKWYTYDAEGRVLMVDGVKSGNQIVADQKSTILSYDALGRRATARVFVKHADPDPTIPGGPTGGFDTGKITRPDGEGPLYENFFSWDEYYTEAYSYTDLGYLSDIHVVNIEQKNQSQHLFTFDTDDNGNPQTHDLGSFPLSPDISGAVNLELAHYDYDLLGNQIDSQNWGIRFTSRTSDGAEAIELNSTTNHYAIGGLQWQELTQWQDDGFGDRFSSIVSHIDYQHDEMGNITQEVYRKDPDSHSEIDTTYTYLYSSEFGGEKLRQILQTTTDQNIKQNGGTEYTFDGRGNILTLEVDQPSTFKVGEGFRATQSDFFINDNSGQVIAQFRTSEPGSRINDPPPQQTHDHRDYFYVAGQQIAVTGTGTLAAAQFNPGFTPVSEAYPALSPSGYTVNTSDTLAGIAQAVYGDSRLWYLIADANNVGFGPSDSLASEAGKVYRIPHVVTNSDRADTFTPYNPSNIFGANLPVPYLNVVTQDQCGLAGRILATVVIVAAAALVAYATGGAATALAGQFLSGTTAGIIGAGVGAAAGDVASQELSIGFGLKKDGFNWEEVAAAGIEGSISKGFNLDKLGTGGRIVSTTLSQIGNEIAGVAGSGGSAGITQLVLDGALSAAAGAADSSTLLNATNSNWGQAVLSVAGTALDPASGWAFHFNSTNWDNVITQAVGAFTKVAVDGILPHEQDPVAKMDPRESPYGAGSPSPGDYPSPGGIIGSLVSRAGAAVGSALYSLSDAASQLVATLADGGTGSDATASAGSSSEPTLGEIIDQLTPARGVAIVVGDETNTEQLAERLGRPRSWGDALALANGYSDPRLVKKGDIFYDYDLTQQDADAANAKWYPVEQQGAHDNAVKAAAAAAAAAAARERAVQDAKLDADIAAGRGFTPGPGSGPDGLLGLQLAPGGASPGEPVQLQTPVGGDIPSATLVVVPNKLTASFSYGYGYIKGEAAALAGKEVVLDKWPDNVNYVAENPGTATVDVPEGWTPNYNAGFIRGVLENGGKVRFGSQNFTKTYGIEAQQVVGTAGNPGDSTLAETAQDLAEASPAVPESVAPATSAPGQVSNLKLIAEARLPQAITAFGQIAGAAATIDLGLKWSELAKSSDYLFSGQLSEDFWTKAVQPLDSGTRVTGRIELVGQSAVLGGEDYPVPRINPIEGTVFKSYSADHPWSGVIWDDGVTYQSTFDPKQGFGITVTLPQELRGTNPIGLPDSFQTYTIDKNGQRIQWNGLTI